VITGIHSAVELGARGFQVLGSMIGFVARGAQALGRGLLSTVDEASNLNETTSKIGVVFGDSADDVLQFGKTSARAIGMSKNQALSAAGTYGNLFRSMGLTSDTSAEMSMRMVTLAGDLASFNNIKPDEALEKLRAGLTGEAEPLKALGVNITASTIAAKAMALGLKEVNGELPAAAKVQAAYALILEQTALAQGDFGKTSSGLANGQRIWQGLIEDLSGTIGQGLLPALAGLFALGNRLVASDKVQGWAQGLSASLGKVGPLIERLMFAFTVGSAGKGGAAGGIKEIFDVLALSFPILKLAAGPLSQVIGYIGALIDIISGAGSIGGAAAGIGGLIGQIFGDLAKSRGAMLEMGIQILQGLVEGIAGALPALLETGIQVLLSLASAITQALPVLIPAIVAIIPAMIQALISAVPMLIEGAIALIMGLVTGITASLPILIQSIPALVTALVTAIIESAPLLIVAAVQLLLALGTALIENLPLLLDMVISVIDGIIKVFISTDWAEIGANIVAGIQKGFNDMWSQFTANVAKRFTDLWAKTKRLLGIHSPSAVYAGLGEQMAAGLGMGWSRAFDAVGRDIAAGLTVNPTIGGVGRAGMKPAPTGGGNTYVFHFRDTTLNEAELTAILQRQELLYGA
jgi:hypothetical protein